MAKVDFETRRTIEELARLEGRSLGEIIRELLDAGIKERGTKC